MANNPQITSKSVALVLTGGGARGAYQAGVAKGLSQIFAEDSCANPISIISGMSAGSINGSFLACGLSDLPKATKYLSETWSGLTTTDIFRSDPIALGKIGLRLISDVTFGSLSSSKLSEALLDTRPLGKLLRDRIPFERIDSQISAGHLHGLAVSAYSYSFQRTAIFYQAKSPALVRDRARRKTRPTQITDRHVMASAAIPVLFPPIEIDGHFFGDG